MVTISYNVRMLLSSPHPSITDFDTALRYGIRNAEVWHRYSEFDVLHQYLLHTHPSSIIPPLPEKKVSGIVN